MLLFNQVLRLEINEINYYYNYIYNYYYCYFLTCSLSHSIFFSSSIKRKRSRRPQSCYSEKIHLDGPLQLPPPRQLNDTDPSEWIHCSNGGPRNGAGLHWRPPRQPPNGRQHDGGGGAQRHYLGPPSRPPPRPPPRDGARARTGRPPRVDSYGGCGGAVQRGLIGGALPMLDGGADDDCKDDTDDDGGGGESGAIAGAQLFARPSLGWHS